MKTSKLFLVWSLILNMATVYPCAHNVDPASIETVGYSVAPKSVSIKDGETEVTTYSRYELVSGTSIPNKKLVKMYFVKSSAAEDISFIDITKRKNRKIKEKLQEVRSVAAELPSRGTRGGAEDKTLVYGDKKITPPLLIDETFIKEMSSSENITIKTIYEYISSIYDVEKGTEEHTAEMNLKLQNAVELGLKVLVVAVEQVDNGGSSSSIVMKIQDRVKVNQYARIQEKKDQATLNRYTREVVLIKGLELDMSSHGDWAFNIGGSNISQYVYRVMRSRDREDLAFTKWGAPIANQSLKNLSHFTDSFTKVEVNISIPLADYTEGDSNSEIIIARVGE